ncbi:MAG: acetyltransferase [Gammaproteobacteria bacterium]|nr:acetyltransferase [Gammaproteobacteria bacterium]
MSQTSTVFILGAGGHAKVVASTLLAIGREVGGFFDDNPSLWGKKILGISVLGPLEEVAAYRDRGRFILGIGSNLSRKVIASKFRELEWDVVIHPRAYVDPTVSVDRGTVVFAGAILQPEASIAEHAIINTGAIVEHDCVVKSYVHVAPGARLAGHVVLNEGVLIGLGAVVLPGIHVGSWTVVGAGTVVHRDLSSRVTVVGVPARVIREHGNS